MKKLKKTRWKNLSDLPVQYYFDGKYFEIRGKVPEHMSRPSLFETIFRKISEFENQEIFPRSNSSNTAKEQADLFIDIPGREILNKIPVLRGYKSLKNDTNHSKENLTSFNYKQYEVS